MPPQNQGLNKPLLLQRATAPAHSAPLLEGTAHRLIPVGGKAASRFFERVR